eukprot:6631947-Pyramimonas_sp.AAC.1
MSTGLTVGPSRFARPIAMNPAATAHRTTKARHMLRGLLPLGLRRSAGRSGGAPSQSSSPRRR